MKTIRGKTAELGTTFYRQTCREIVTSDIFTDIGNLAAMDSRYKINEIFLTMKVNKTVRRNDREVNGRENMAEIKRLPQLVSFLKNLNR